MKQPIQLEDASFGHFIIRTRDQQTLSGPADHRNALQIAVRATVSHPSLLRSFKALENVRTLTVGVALFRIFDGIDNAIVGGIEQPIEILIAVIRTLSRTGSGLVVGIAQAALSFMVDFRNAVFNVGERKRRNKHQHGKYKKSHTTPRFIDQRYCRSRPVFNGKGHNRQQIEGVSKIFVVSNCEFHVMTAMNGGTMREPEQSDFIEVDGLKITLAEIHAVVDRFYTQVATDDLLHVPFSTVNDWPHHIQKMTHFWWMRLGGAPYMRERYNPVEKHFRAGFNEEFLTRWLGLFRRTQEEILQPPQIGLWMGWAEQMGQMLSFRNSQMIAMSQSGPF